MNSKIELGNASALTPFQKGDVVLEVVEVQDFFNTEDQYSEVGNSPWNDLFRCGIAAREGHDPKVKESGKRDAGIDVANGARDGARDGARAAQEKGKSKGGLRVEGVDVGLKVGPVEVKVRMGRENGK